MSTCRNSDVAHNSSKPTKSCNSKRLPRNSLISLDFHSVPLSVQVDLPLYPLGLPRQSSPFNVQLCVLILVHEQIRAIIIVYNYNKWELNFLSINWYSIQMVH